MSFFLIKFHNTKDYGGVDVCLHAFFPSVANGVQLQAPVSLPPWKNPPVLIE